MKVLNTIKETRGYLNQIRSKGLSIGFVPTMGALHEGHLSLVREAKKENDFVVCSIFVNPVQFNNEADLKKYPREIESDIKKLKKEKCDLLFHPSAEEMYPEPDNTKFDFGDLNKVMEGEFRPGHFNGVAVVVKKLFEIIEPARAYFGLKDYQQLVIIHKLTKDYNLPVEIVPCAIIREENGLAMSSRNELLSEPEKKQASLIYVTLKRVKIQSGFATISELKESVFRQFKKNKTMKLEYFEIVDLYSLKPLRTWTESNYIIACIAVYIGKVRLIDNIILFS
ncbi:MAG: pantoate--beta-alanine ligase [Bacteroidales bacterium]|nr:pantoate--beta-alanine ligase [Bacteroidales bacterium]